eukprot:2193137-Ditylum_brightwellii.AAC.1
MEEWHVAFDAEQKKCFREQEKKISKKIDLNLSNISSAMEDKLNARQVGNNKNNEFSKEIFSKIITALANVQDSTTAHGNQIGSLQDFTQKKNGKHQKHGADDNNLDSDMYEPDVLHHNRDELASNRDGQGDV